MTYLAPKFWLALPFKPSRQLVSVALLAVMGYLPGAGFSATVTDHNRNHYGRVQSISPAGVALLVGCAGGASEVIPLSQLESVDFTGPCSPPRMQSSTSPSTAGCPGPHAMMFEVLAGEQPGWFTLTVPNVSLQNDVVTLTLRDGRQIAGAAGNVKRIFYQDTCLSTIRPDLAWGALFTIKHTP